MSTVVYNGTSWASGYKQRTIGRELCQWSSESSINAHTWFSDAKCKSADPNSAQYIYEEHGVSLSCYPFSDSWACQDTQEISSQCFRAAIQNA